MKKSVSFWYLVPLLLFILFSFSCSGGGGGGTTSSGSTGGYLNGSWSGQYTSTKVNNRGAITANINQTGTQLSGTVTVTNTSAGTVSGSINGPCSNSSGPGTIQMGVAYNQLGTATFTGSYTDSRIEGTYNNVTEGDYGTFSLTKAGSGSTPPPSYIYSQRCGSQGFQYKECIAQARISSIGIVAQHSYADCIQGTDWGYFDYQSVSKIWVTDGCDATFGYNSF